MDNFHLKESLNNYRIAHFSDESGYQPYTHNLMRDDVIHQMYEYAHIFRKSFAIMGWNNDSIPSKKVLEIGSAWGLRLNQLLGFNFNPENLVGIDIQEAYIKQAARINPLITYKVMSATEIRYPDKFFNCSIACVALSAMLEDLIIDQSISEMCRVTREFIVIVDNFNSKYSCKKNGAIYLKGVDKKHIKNLKSLNSVEQVVLIGSFWTTSELSWLFYRLLNKIGFSQIAYTAAIRIFAKHSHNAYLAKLKNNKNEE